MIRTLGHEQGRPAEQATQAVEVGEDAGASDEGEDEAVFAGEVEEDEADEDGEEPLAGDAG